LESTQFSCNEGIYTIDVNLDVSSKEVDIRDNIMMINANYTTNAQTVHYYYLDLRNNIPSNETELTGTIIVNGTIYLLGKIYSNISQADPGIFGKSIFSALQYEPSDFGTLIVVETPTLSTDLSYCRSIFNPDFSSPNSRNLFLNLTIVKTQDVCSHYVGADRSWVIAVMVVCGIFGVIVGLFSLITCQVKSLRDKIWESE